MTDQLPPAGIRLAADDGLRRIDEGRVLIGGSPLRVITLADAGAAVVDAWIDGAPLADVKSPRALARRLLDAGILHPVVSPSVSAPPVTVVVPAKDDATDLERLLPSIRQPTIVVDDASDDGLSLAAAAERHGARLVRRDVNGGPGAARMTGTAEVETEFVVFVDADVEMPDGWWPALAAHFDDPSVVAVAPRIVSRPGPTLRERYESVHSPLDLGPAAGNVAPMRRIAYVPTAAFAVRVSALEAVGGFDPDFRVGEDVDLVWRLSTEVGTVRYAPEVEVVHRPRLSWPALFQQRRSYGGSSVALAAKHGRWVAPARCSRWSVAAWGATAAGHPLLGIGLAAGSSAALAKKFDGLPDATREAARIAGWGHLQAGLGLAGSVSRAWWPLAFLAARLRRLRLAMVAAMIVPPLRKWWKGSRPADPVRSTALLIADELAYGAGLWEQVIRHRDARALMPDLTEWPGRRAAVESGTVAD